MHFLHETKKFDKYDAEFYCFTFFSIMNVKMRWLLYETNDAYTKQIIHYMKIMTLMMPNFPTCICCV